MEEFIFDDDVDEVGAEVEAHCPKCKADTQHVVVSKYEDEIRRVQCNPCGDVHPYRKPRGESDEEEPAPAVKKKAVKAKPTWEQVMAKHAKKQPKAYQLGEYFKEMEVLSHPKFGVGFVTENIGDDKIEVTFKDDKRVLVHNRKGLTLPFMRPMAQPKGKKGKAAPVAPRQRQRERQEGGGQAGTGQGAGQAAEAGAEARAEEASRQAQGRGAHGGQEAGQDRRQEGQEGPLALRGPLLHQPIHGRSIETEHFGEDGARVLAQAGRRRAHRARRVRQPHRHAGDADVAGRRVRERHDHAARPHLRVGQRLRRRRGWGRTECRRRRTARSSPSTVRAATSGSRMAASSARRSTRAGVGGEARVLGERVERRPDRAAQSARHCASLPTAMFTKPSRAR